MTSVHGRLIQKQSLTFDRYFFAPLNATKNFEEYICLNRVSYCHTPLNPLSRGEYQYTINSSSSKKKNSISTSPLERGRGCVTSAHSCLNQKQSLTFDRYFFASLNATKNFEKYICLNRVSYRNTPLNPLSRGESHNTP